MVDLGTCSAGDRLRVKDSIGGCPGAVSNMCKFQGMDVTLACIYNYRDFEGKIKYYARIMGDERGWNWFPEMFEYVDEESELRDLDSGCVTELLFG